MIPRFLVFLLFLFASKTRAFDHVGHQVINQLALTALPLGFPDFVKTPDARSRIGYLGGEADRWRNTNELPLKHANNPDHYFDVEDLTLYGISPSALTPFRYEFVAQMAVVRATSPERFPRMDHARDPEHVRSLPGFLPWAITEYYGKLESAFSCLKAFRENGSSEEITHAQENVLYIMGVMGHFVADATQPLHTTTRYNGWVGDNPKSYTTNRTFHALIDGDFLEKVGYPSSAELQTKLRSAKTLWNNSSGPNSPVFGRVLQFVTEQHSLVEPLYQMEKDGKFKASSADRDEAKQFLGQQFITAAQFLSDLWQSAWEQAPADVFLKTHLAARAKARRPDSP